MDTERRKRGIHRSEIRAVRALRTALTVLHDSFDDLDIVLSLREDPPAEIQEARAASRSVFEPLLKEFVTSVRLLDPDPVLAENRIARLIKTCNQTIEQRLAEERSKEPNRLLEALKKAKERIQLHA